MSRAEGAANICLRQMLSLNNNIIFSFFVGKGWTTSITHAVWQTVTGQEPTVTMTRRRRRNIISCRMRRKTKGWRLSNAKSCPDTTPTRSLHKHDPDDQWHQRAHSGLQCHDKGFNHTEVRKKKDMRVSWMNVCLSALCRWRAEALFCVRQSVLFCWTKILAQPFGF